MKICSVCKQEKELSEFGKWAVLKCGLRPYCKKCAVEQYSQTKEARRAYHQTENGKRLKREYRERNAIKNKCRKAINIAILKGLVERGPCIICATTDNIEAHHPDYSKPLSVEWLCHKHHTELHHAPKANAA